MQARMRGQPQLRRWFAGDMATIFDNIIEASFLASGAWTVTVVEYIR